MRTLGKFPIFMALILVAACSNKKVPAEAAEKASQPMDVQATGEGEGDLETACFEGDQEACDELGH